MRFRGVILLLIAAAAAAFAQPQPEPAEEVDRLTTQMRDLRRAGWLTEEFSRAARERAQAFRRLIESNPRQALDSALSLEDAARIRQWVPEWVETSGRWQGPMEVRVEDDPISGRSRRHFYLTAQGEEVEVFPAEPPEQTACLEDVAVEGVRLDGVIAARTIEVRAASASCALTGTQNIAIIVVNFTTASVPASVTPAFLNNAFFGAGGLNAYWQEASYGQLSATGQVFGPYAVNVASCSSTSAIRSAAIAAADADVDFRNFSRLFIVHPNVSGCSLGVGTIGCSTLSSGDGTFQASTSWLRADYLTTVQRVVSVAAHEGGHNFGLMHSSTYDYGAVPLGAPGTAGVYNEYWDVYSAMGLSYTISGTTLTGHFAAPQKAALGWITEGSRFQTASSGTFTLTPYSTAGAGLKALRVPRPGTNKFLWLEYRQNQGLFDSTLGVYSSNVYNGALIHYDDPNEIHYPETLLLDFNPSATPNNFNNAALAAGSSWNDPHSPLRIQVVSASASGLVVTISNTTASPCDLNQDGAVNIVDVQSSVNRAIGIIPCGIGDLDGSGSCTVIDLMRVVNAVLGGACVTGS